MDHLHLAIPSALIAFYAERAPATLTATRLLLAAWCVMSTLEWIRNFDIFRGDGLLSWRVLSLRPGLLFRDERAKAVFWDSAVPVILGLRLAAALGLTAASQATALAVLLLVVVLTGWYLGKRTWLGEDGADQMGQIVAIGALLMALGAGSGRLAVSFAGVLLIAGQLTISYFFAGFEKLRSPEWRGGQAIVGVMGTHSYGHAYGARLASGSARLSLVFCWSLFLLEAAFPLILLSPHPLFMAALTVYFLFHLGTAYFMGLNTFLWAFAATYPAALLANEMLGLALTGS
jgi:hypothetical protein